MTIDVDWLLGRRFVADFTVVAVDADPARTVTIAMSGDRFAISLEELTILIERGLVAEWPDPAALIRRRST